MQLEVVCYYRLAGRCQHKGSPTTITRILPGMANTLMIVELRGTADISKYSGLKIVLRPRLLINQFGWF